MKIGKKNLEKLVIEYRKKQGANEMKKWKLSNLENAEYLGTIEFQDDTNEFHTFEIMENENKLIFGSFCNAGFLESGYILKEGFSTDETLIELLEELEIYYNHGKEFISLLVYNDRM